MKFKTTLIARNIIAEGTMDFHFKKPEGYEWKAGQFVDITLIDPKETDGEGNTRTFSIVSAPHEPDIVVATRMRDTAFKHTLKEAELGTEVEISSASGSFALHQKGERGAIMLVGGIGIAPFVGMIKDATEKNLPHRITLFYSNRRPEDTAYFAELSALQERNKNFVFVPTMSNMEKSAQDWTGETGYITRDMIEKYAPKRVDAVYYSAGPEGMVGAMRKILNEMDVSDDDIRTEEFSGY